VPGDASGTVYHAEIVGTKIETQLDEEQQIIRQRVDGDVDASEFAELEGQVEACVQRLRDPGDVRLLVDGRTLGRPSLRVRREIMRTFTRPNLTAMAIWTPDRAAHVILRMVALLIGKKTLRGFATEEEAVRWLLAFPRRGG
jgi:hypothetical protein